MTFQEWAAENRACGDGVEYLKGKGPTLATWLQSCGIWRDWVAQKLGYRLCPNDRLTCPGEGCSICDEERTFINQPKNHQAICKHFKTVILPALRKQGIR